MTVFVCPTPRIALLAAIVAASTLAPAAGACAQTTGSIDGSVTDIGGGALPGVTVTLSGDLLPAGRVQVTDLDGRFVFDTLPASVYVARFTLSSFETREIRLSVDAGAAVSVDVVLEIERLMEAVSVIADEPTIFATNVVAEPMLEQQPAITSVVAVVDNLPGVTADVASRSVEALGGTFNFLTDAPTTRSRRGRDAFGIEPGRAVDSDSELLFSGGPTLGDPDDGGSSSDSRE